MAIIPAIGKSTDGTMEIAHLLWTGTVDPGISKAIDEGLAHHGVMGIYSTPHGSIAWSLFAIESEQNFATNPDNLYWFNLILKPAPMFTKWVKILKTQSELRLAIEHKGTTIFTLLLENDAVSQYCKLLEQQFAEWGISANPSALDRLTVEVQDWIYDTVVPQRIEMIIESTRNGESLETLIKLVGERAIIELPETSTLRSLAGKNLSMTNHLTEWEASFSLSDLAKVAPNKEEQIRRDWLYTRLCMEKYSPGRYKIPHQAGDIWLWKTTAISRLRLLWAASKNLRLLLDRDWHKIIQIKDVPSPPLDPIYLANFSHLKTNIDRTSDIIKSGFVNRQYGLSRAVIHVGMIGCRSIHYESIVPDCSQVLVKFVVNELEYNSCLFGVISPLIGGIEWVSPELIHPETVEIVNFLVAITFRDLLVCRTGFDGQIGQTKPAKKGKRKPKPQTQSPRIELIARIKKGSSISQSTSDADTMLSKLSKFFRVEHLRRLPEGHKASSYQSGVAKEYGYILPEGHTFVRPSGEQTDPNMYRSVSLINLFLK